VYVFFDILLLSWRGGVGVFFVCVCVYMLFFFLFSWKWNWVGGEVKFVVVVIVVPPLYDEPNIRTHYTLDLLIYM